MADFKKILDHPEVQGIIDKLMMGDSPKDVSVYLKNKYDKPDENHLRLAASLLEQFVKNYCNTSDFLDKIVKDEKNGALDKTIAKSLINNQTWQDRLANLADDKIDIEKRLLQQLHLMDVRAEQIFDKIQENPGSTKLDYVLTKYFELSTMLLEKADRIINKTPDQRIEHIHSVQVVEQHSTILQEAIRRAIARLDPDLASDVMDMITQEFDALKPPNNNPIPIDKAKKEVIKLEAKAELFDEEISNFVENENNGQEDES